VMRRRKAVPRASSGKRTKDRGKVNNATVGFLVLALMLIGAISFYWEANNPKNTTTEATSDVTSSSSGKSLDAKAADAAQWARNIHKRRRSAAHAPAAQAKAAPPSASVVAAPPSPREGVAPPHTPLAPAGAKATGDDDSSYVPSVISGYDLLYGLAGDVEKKLMPRCKFEEAEAGYLAGCTTDNCLRFASLEQAKEACLAIGDGCGGVIQDMSGQFETRSGSTVQASASGEKAFRRVCKFTVVPPPPAYAPPPGMDLDDLGTKVSGRPTVYVSVASYRDSRCTGTINSIFERAQYPDRVFVGVVQQNSPGSGDSECVQVPTPCSAMSSQTLCRFAKQIRVHMVQAEESLGPTFGRHRADRLYRGETYAMQVDAHSTLLKNWDSEAISQHNKTNNHYAVMTNYPSDVTAVDSTGTAKWDSTPMMCASHFEGEMLRFDSNPEQRVPSRLHGSPVLQPFWGAGASFARGHRIVRVPYDCCLSMMFTGEEIGMATRMWTHGYDLYTFHHSVIYHQYGPGPGGKRPPMFWENGFKHQKDADKSVRRLKHVMGFAQPPGTYEDKDIEKYSLGTKADRPIEKYWRLFGINFKTKRVQDNCPIVTSFQVHDKLTMHLRPNGKGIDYEKVRPDLFHASY